MASTPDRRLLDSGIEVKPLYRAADAPPPEPEPPGVFPFTRGPYPDMYRGRPWTIRQYAGFASAEESNERYRYLLASGQTGLSIAFDLPTQLGYDSDDPVAVGEVGRTGVAVDSIADMELLLDGIPLDEVSTSMTINAPAALLLLLYELVAEGQGVPGTALRGTVQNDILKEYVARGNYIFPPRPSMRLTTDLFAYCEERIPRWNTISVSGYHIREAGSTAAQELAFTLANGIAYCDAAVAAGLSPDTFGARLSFFFNAHNDFFQEVAKFRAARSLWAQIMRDRFGARTAEAQALRFHAQTGGSTLTAQQPENNIVRVAIQALSAACGGAQSLHTNSFDDLLGIAAGEGEIEQPGGGILDVETGLLAQLRRQRREQRRTGALELEQNPARRPAAGDGEHAGGGAEGLGAGLPAFEDNHAPGPMQRQLARDGAADDAAADDGEVGAGAVHSPVLPGRAWRCQRVGAAFGRVQRLAFSAD